MAGAPCLAGTYSGIVGSLSSSILRVDPDPSLRDTVLSSRDGAGVLDFNFPGTWDPWNPEILIYQSGILGFHDQEVSRLINK